MAVVKRIGNTSARRAELRFEIFNLLNRANFANPTLIAFAGVSASEAPLSSFGRIRSTTTSARQIQLGALAKMRTPGLLKKLEPLIA